MPCFHPREMHYAGLTESGARHYVFDLRDSVDPYRQLRSPTAHIVVPCGQCIGCRIRRAEEKSARIWLEWQMSKADSCFLTLTYDDVHLPSDRSLSVSDYQLFLKSVRAFYPGRKIRYFVSGEYGANFARPHYHFILFGIDFRDSVSSSFGSFYTSSVVSRFWERGFHTISPVSDATIAYVSKYVIKKLIGLSADEHYGSRLPEFGISSKGLSKAYYDAYADKMWDRGYIVYGNKFHKCLPFRYFEKLLKKVDELRLQKIKDERILRYLKDRKEVFDRDFKQDLAELEAGQVRALKFFSKLRHTQI